MEHTLDQPATQLVVPPIAITDGELLMRFAQHGDEQAFATIVEKHGRLVWAVCWQVLREHHAIEDAFQSTFFILAKRARSIRSCDSLCAWLYRVAYRTALRARMSVKARPLSLLGTEADTMEEWSEFDEKLRAIEQDEQRAALLEELQSLPEKYQQALALCYLEGKTRRAIADELGCSLETVKGRLARGRQVLRHRLIRRGVSLSLAMAAMTVPVKTATAAVTPSLIGLTVTGATAWAAGTLGAANAAGGATAAKAVSTTSAHVIHLAHQGTVAMTVASFAKPVVIAIALLGAVSGTLAVDSTEGQEGGGTVQAIDLTADAEHEGEAAGQTAIEGEAPAITIATTAEAGSKDQEKKHSIESFAFEFADGPKKVRAIPRGKTLTITAPAPPEDILVPAVPPMPEVPVATTLNIDVPEMDLELQLKMAELQTRVSELQLEAKQLEIAALGAAGEKDKEEFLRQSREKLTRAEAEQIKIQIQQQRALIEQLRKALEEQASEVGKQAAKAAIQAGRVAMEAEKVASIEAARAAMQAKDAAIQAAQRAALKVRERAVVVDPSTGHAVAANTYPAASGLPTWEQSIEAQQGALSLEPGHRIKIEILTDDQAFEDICTVEPMGTVALGAKFGRAYVKGLSVIEAEEVIKDTINQVEDDAKVKVQVTYLHPTVTYAPPAIISAPVPVTPPVHESKPEPHDDTESE